MVISIWYPFVGTIAFSIMSGLFFAFINVFDPNYSLKQKIAKGVQAFILGFLVTIPIGFFFSLLYEYCPWVFP